MMDLISGLLVLCVILIFINPFFRFFRSILISLSKNFQTESIDLKEKYGSWAVVTGSTDGIGKEYAKELARKNLNLVLIGRNLEKLKNTQEEIKQINPDIEIKIIQADFSKGKEELNKIEEQLKDTPVGILVNNVGQITEYPMYLEEIPVDDLWGMININMGATTLMTHMVIKDMKKRNKGAIVNISSAANMMPIPLMAVYAASKIYVKYFSEAVQAECSKYGLTVQCLSPFYVNTRMIGYSQRLQSNQIISPDPSTYAKNAIQTLGKLDSTTGYWFHDLQEFFMSLPPVWMRSKLGFFINRSTRHEYFMSLKKKSDE